MKVEAVVVGNELLNGDLADKNTATFGGLLREQGLRLYASQTVPDDMDAIGAALRLAASRADLVLISGGLGPTEDDITVAAVARAAGVELVRDHEALERLRHRYQARGARFTENNAKQVDHPVGSVLLPNARGTAPGVRMVWNDTTLFFFPGVPLELAHLAEKYLLPWLRQNAPVRPYETVVFKTFGRTESMVAESIDTLVLPASIHVAYRAHFPEIHVSLHGHGSGGPESSAELHRAALLVREELAHLVFTEDPQASLVDTVVQKLIETEQTLALAESCTGGYLAKIVTDVPGSSSVLKEGLVVYSNASKMARLGLPKVLLEEHGAVSEAVARHLAESVRLQNETDWGVGITGIAGPGGGTETKPVGTVHIAVCNRHSTQHKRRLLPFGRARNRIISAYTALDMIRRFQNKK